MSNLHISIRAEPVFHLGKIPITNSLICTWLLMAVFILVANQYHQQKKKAQPTKLVLVIDMILEGLLGFFENVAGKKARRFFPLLATFFFFIIFGNWLGLLPGMGTIGLKVNERGLEHLVPLFRGPTADLNTTFALAILSVGATQYFSIKYLGLKGHLKKYFNISNPIYLFVGFLEIISLFSKVLSFSFRLFGNIFAGEVLLSVIAFLIPVFAGLPFLMLEVFIGFIQALVFTMLSLVFMSVETVSHEH